MTSRLTVSALAFAVLATASLAFAGAPRTDAAPAAKAVQLERVVITAQRVAA